MLSDESASPLVGFFFNWLLFALTFCRWLKLVFPIHKKMLLSSYFSELPRRVALKLVQDALDRLKGALLAVGEKTEVQAVRIEIRLTTAGSELALDTHLM